MGPRLTLLMLRPLPLLDAVPLLGLSMLQCRICERTMLVCNHWHRRGRKRPDPRGC